MLGKLEIQMQKNEMRHLSYTIYKKNQLKWILDLNIRHDCKTPQRKHREKLLDIGRGNDFLDI